MRTVHLFASISLLVLVTSVTAVEPTQEFIIGLSPYTPAVERPKQQALIQRFLLTEAPRGSQVVVCDGWSLTVVCQATIPAVSYDSPTARAPRVASALSALGRWFAGLDTNQSPHGLRDTGAVKVPEWLYAASAEPAKGRRTILILASPICIVPSEPTFSMVNNRYPSDGQLLAGDKSIYSIADKASRLANTSVLWAYASESIWASQNHKERVARWWSLYIAGQGGTLAAFSADAAQTMLAAARTNHRAIGEYAVNPDDNTRVMHTAAQREVQVETQAQPVQAPESALQHLTEIEPPSAPSPVVAVVTPETTLPNRLEATPVVTEPEPLPKPTEDTSVLTPVPLEIPKPAKGNIGIAAVWSAEPGTDIDIWVAAKSGMPEAYWKEPRVERVHYFRDIRSAQPMKENTQWRALWEYAEIERAELREPTVWLNVYAAKGPVRGIVRVQFEGRVVDRPFRFDVTRGNRGRDANLAARSRSPYWQRINISEFFQSP